MHDPLSYPYYPVHSYLDGGAPAVTATEFYNPTQDHIARLFHGSLGTAYSICTEEFDRESDSAAAAAGDRFGSQLIVQTATNVEGFSTGALGAGDHGIWRVWNVAGGVSDFIARDAETWVGTQEFIWTAKVQFFNGTFARLETAGNEGFLIGLGNLASNLPCFYCGPDFPDWQTFANGAGVATGVPVADGVWYWLIITRQGSDVKWYIKNGANPLALERTLTWGANLTACRRYVRMNQNAGGAAADGFYIDMFARGVPR